MGREAGKHSEYNGDGDRNMSVLDLFDLSGKVAVVTGGARGLGRQSALALAEAGADVALCDLLETEGEQTCQELIGVGRRSYFEPVDVTHSDQVERFVMTVVERLGKIDILVNNAAVPSLGVSLEAIEDAAWKHSIETNLNSLFYVTKPVARHMIAREGGSIINMASMAGLVISNIFPRH